MLKELKEFIMRGNVIDMAVGVIIGGAFSAIINSLVTDIFTPILGLLTNGINFSELYVSLDGKHYDTLAAAREASAPVFAYGNFIQTVIQFLLMAIVIFFFIKAVNKLKRPAPAPEVTTKTCPFCKSEIPLEATRCPHCTSQIPDFPAQ